MPKCDRCYYKVKGATHSADCPNRMAGDDEDDKRAQIFEGATGARAEFPNDITASFKTDPQEDVTFADARFANGVIVGALTVETDEGTKPAILFRFRDGTGKMDTGTILLVRTHELQSIKTLVADAVDNAIRYAAKKRKQQ